MGSRDRWLCHGPWHGHHYRSHDGASPPRFDEKVPTFRVRLESGLVFVDEKGAAVNDRILHLIAEPIEVTGEIRGYGDRRVLHASLDSYRRL